jgi:hypothetical protein
MTAAPRPSLPTRSPGARSARLTPAVFAPLLLSLAASCGEDTPGTAPDGPNQARVAFTATTGTIGAPLGVGAPAGATDGTATAEEDAAGLVVESGDDRLVITRVQLVVRELELEGPDDDDCDDDDDDDRPAGADCDDEIEIGPFLVELPLTDDAQPRLTLPVPAGMYEEFELVLHTPDDDDDDDRAFLAANPGFRRVSALVEGTFNGQPFTYVSRAKIKHELEFEPPIVIGEGGESVTVDVNVGAWFARRGGGLISPLEGSMPGEARAKIENNIRHTFRAFRDRDRDGRRDD